MDPVVERVAALASEHGLVPFMGAGCSLGHLKVDWNSISDYMAHAVKSTGVDNITVAQLYQDQFGRDGLCDLLKQHLTVSQYDGSLGQTHLQILSMGAASIYTTNQDNVMEKCLEQYGRNYRTIVTYEDLAAARPGDSLYIKFHGDLNVPESVVFTTSDFESRMSSKNFLNIRLQSDLLTKNFFFIGYSLRDPNLKMMLEELRSILGELPESFLLAWEWSQGLADLCAEFKIHLIVPLEVHTEAKSLGEAFTLTISDIIRETAHQKVEHELKWLFEPADGPTIEVINEYEVSTLEQGLGHFSLEKQVELFRNLVDARIIPTELEDRVVRVFMEMANQCQSQEDSEEIKFAAGHFNVKKMDNIIKVLSAVYSTANVRVNDAPFLVHMASDPPPELHLGAVVAATVLLHEKGHRITDGMRRMYSFVLEYLLPDLESLPEGVLEEFKKVAICAWFDRTWGDHTVYEEPFKRLERLSAIRGARHRRTKTAKEIADDMMSTLPKWFNRHSEN